MPSLIHPILDQWFSNVLEVRVVWAAITATEDMVVVGEAKSVLIIQTRESEASESSWLVGDYKNTPFFMCLKFSSLRDGPTHSL